MFYAVINIGALSAPLIGGWTQEHAGWPWSFAVASFGSLLSVSVLALGRMRVDGTPAEEVPGMTQPPSVPPELVRRQLALVLAAGVVFAVGVVQSHSSLLLWARDRTDRHIGSFEIPVAWFAAAPAALVLLVASPLSAIFAVLRRGHREPSTLRKIAIGLAVSGLAFVPLWITSARTHGGLRVSPLWVLGCMTMLAIGELLVPALAPSEITRITPPERRGRGLSYWFVALAAGNVVGGWV
ncbi:MAG: MFS transporter [Pseudoxanthomonas sp.]